MNSINPSDLFQEGFENIIDKTLKTESSESDKSKVEKNKAKKLTTSLIKNKNHSIAKKNFHLDG